MKRKNETVLHYELTQNFALKISQRAPKISKSLLEEIDTIWEKESKKKKLFNGVAFVVDDFDKELITGHFVPYKYLVAQSSDQNIKKKLKLKTLAVSAITACDGKILIGKRSENSLLYPKFYESVPAGTFGGKKEPIKLGPIGHLLIELKEETHLTKTAIDSLRPLGLFYNKESQVYDIAFLIRCRAEMSKKPLPKTLEHEKLSWLTVDECKKLKNFVPESLKLLEYFQEHFLA